MHLKKFDVKMNDRQKFKKGKHQFT